MKRYFSISLTTFIFSALNVLTYLLLGIIMGNTAYSEVFLITYPLQYAVLVMSYFFASASNIRANREKNENCVESGMILGILFGLIVFLMPVIFVDGYMQFMNVDIEFYRTFTLMSFGQLFFSYVIGVIAEKLYYKNDDKKANWCNIGFIVLNVVTVSVTALITKTQWIIATVNLSALLIYSVTWLALNLRKFHLDFSIKKNIRYESMYMFGDLLLFIIYLIGLKRVFGFGAEYSIALNFVALVTDPQWDAIGTIAKISKIDISQCKYNYKTGLKNTSAVIMFYICTSVILFFSLASIYDVVLKIGIIYLAIQIVDMVIDIFQTNLQPFMLLEYSSIKTTILGLGYKCIRTILSLVIINPYNTNIGQIVAAVVGLTAFLYLRFKHYRLNKEGFLVRKLENFQKKKNRD